MDQISGYPLKAVQELILGRIHEFTQTNIQNKLHEFCERLSVTSEPIFISFGENCGPSIKLREAGLNRIGSGFFDNLVTPIDGMVRLLENDFNQILVLRNLSVGEWEGHDSVFNKELGIFFHHYFYFGGKLEKKELGRHGERRRIDECDIPLFLPSVMAQFEYLAEKLRLTLRSGKKTNILIRGVSGHPVATETTSRILEALRSFGAKNVVVRIIHSEPIPKHFNYDHSIPRFIPESDDRWGSAKAWEETIWD